MYLEINKKTVGPILLTIGIVVASFVKVFQDDTWADEYLALILIVIGAFAFLFSDTVAELLEKDRPHQEWFQKPNHYTQIAGGITMVLCAATIFGMF